MGENIGDLGGLNAAYTAFKMTKQGQSNEKIDGCGQSHNDPSCLC